MRTWTSSFPMAVGMVPVGILQVMAWVWISAQTVPQWDRILSLSSDLADMLAVASGGDDGMVLEWGGDASATAGGDIRLLDSCRTIVNRNCNVSVPKGLRRYHKSTLACAFGPKLPQVRNVQIYVSSKL